MKINHVMSSNVHSSIYDSLVIYFERYSLGCKIYKSEKPLDDMDVYHYYRPHLESKLRSNSVVTVHHDLLDTDSWLDMGKFINRYKEASKVVCLNSNQERLLKELGVYNTVVIPHGYNDEVFNINEIKKVNIKNKLTLGLVSKRYGRKVKGEAYLYEIIKHLDSNLIDFILVGDGRIEDAYKLRKWGFETKVYEYLPYKCFKDLYKNIDALMMISSFEGGPANIPEAIATKTPIFGFNVGMVSDYVVDNKNGLLLSGNVIFDADKINKLARNKKSLNAMVTFCNKTPGNLFSWQEIVGKNIDIYRQIMGNNKLSECVVY